MNGEQLGASLIAGMTLVGLAVAIAGFALGHADVARGALAGAGVAIAYLAVLRRFVRALALSARAEPIGLLDQLILRGGMALRLLVAAAGLAEVARFHPQINLWTAILVFLSYRVLLAGYQLRVVWVARKEPLPPPLPTNPDEDPFTSRESRNLGRRRSQSR